MNNTDPVVYGVNYHRDHPEGNRPQGATSNPGTVQAHIDRTLSAHHGDSHTETGSDAAPTTDPNREQPGARRGNWEVVQGHSSKFWSQVLDDDDEVQAAAERKFWATEHLWDHVF